MLFIWEVIGPRIDGISTHCDPDHEDVYSCTDPPRSSETRPRESPTLIAGGPSGAVRKKKKRFDQCRNVGLCSCVIPRKSQKFCHRNISAKRKIDCCRIVWSTAAADLSAFPLDGEGRLRRFQPLSLPKAQTRVRRQRDHSCALPFCDFLLDTVKKEKRGSL